VITFADDQFPETGGGDERESSQDDEKVLFAGACFAVDAFIVVARANR
jgi:hypothetical protein